MLLLAAVLFPFLSLLRGQRIHVARRPQCKLQMQLKETDEKAGHCIHRLKMLAEVI